MNTISALEYRELTEDQRRRHGDPSSSESEEVCSAFLQAPRSKVGWSTQALWPCTAHSQGDSVTYTIPTSAHRLLYTTMIQTLPAIRVKPKFEKTVRVCWPHYVAHNIIRSGEVSDGGVRRQVLTSTWLDFHAQFYIEKNTAYKRMTGEVPDLTEWSIALPRYVVQKSHPWFYSQSFENAIPLDAEREGGNLLHSYVLRQKIADLLRMQKWMPAKRAWVDIRPDMRFLLGMPSNATFEVPRLWACLANLTDVENEGTQKGHPVYIEYLDVTYEEHNSRFAPGARARIEPASNVACECIFFGGIRYNPTGIEYLGNYSSSLEEDTENACGPFASFSIKYREMTRSADLPAEILEYSTALHHFPSSPERPGFYAYAFASCPGHVYERQTGIPLRRVETRVEILLKNMENLEREEERDSEAEEDGDEALLQKLEGIGKSAQSAASEAAQALAALCADDCGLAASEEIGRAYFAPPVEYRVFAISLIQASISYTYNNSSNKYIVAASPEDIRKRAPILSTPQTPRIAASL